MKTFSINDGLLFGWLALASVALASDGMEHRFVSITARNAFALRDEPPPPPPPPVRPPPQAVVKITGITTILKPSRAILLIQEPGQKSESIVLRENESFGTVELKGIDVASSSVTILNSGKLMTLSMDKDGLAIPVGPAQKTAAPVYQALASDAPRPPVHYAGVVTVEGRSIIMAGTNVHSGIIEPTADNYAPPPAATLTSFQSDPANLLRAKIEQARLQLKSREAQ